MYRECTCATSIVCEVHGNLPNTSQYFIDGTYNPFNEAGTMIPPAPELVNDIMGKVYQDQIERLKEERDLALLKLDIPRKMFSIRTYLDHMAWESTVNNTDNGWATRAYVDANFIVGQKQLEVQTYNWDSTRNLYRGHFAHQYTKVPKPGSDINPYDLSAAKAFQKHEVRTEPF